VNENPAEVATVADLFPGTAHYIDTYHRHGLLTDHSVFAHNVHPTDPELDLMAQAGAWTAHAPPAPPPWAADCSRCAGTSPTASAWPWAPTSAPAPACTCPR